MDLNKKININELIRIVKENKDKIFNKEIDDDVDEVTRFVLTFKIKEGKNKVYSDVVYSAYKVWSTQPDSKKSFSKRFGGLFHSQQETTGYRKQYYSLNYKPAQLLNSAAKLKVKYD